MGQRVILTRLPDITMKDKTAELIPEATYHIYNRAIGTENLFVSGENYRYFLEKYTNYIRPIAETFCYCLMPNHFHFVVRIKNEKEIQNIIDNRPPEALTGFGTLSGLPHSEKNKLISEFLSRQFSNLFNGYSQAFNKTTGRKGALFMRPFKRIRVTDEVYLKKLVQYVHLNPVVANICDFPEEWQFSSYSSIINDVTTFIENEKILELFSDKSNFIYVHKTQAVESEFMGS